MNLAACRTLPAVSKSGTWYRAVHPKYLTSALHTTHTPKIPSRFNEGDPARPQFEILYLAENHQVALFEVRALFGTPSSVIPNPNEPWVVLNVKVTLQRVVDLTDVRLAQVPLGTSAQELTGDWRGYQQRGKDTSVKLPVGTAPTQALGSELFQVNPPLEGFLTQSATLPSNRVLVVFPEHLLTGSAITFQDSGGQRQLHQIVSRNPA